MTPEDFERLQTLTDSRAGYRLTRERMQLAAHRLGPVARREGFDSVEALLAALWAQPVAALAWSVIEALLNTETWFNRDRAAFSVLSRELLPALGHARGAEVRIWSAGCSTGQEVWSLAMAVRRAGMQARILGTELNANAVAKAEGGAYSGFEIQRGLSAASMLEHFRQRDDNWVVSPELRSMARFERANLLEPPTQDAERFDVIFCRHVLEDVTPGRRALLLDHLERRLADDGVLFLAPQEGLDGDTVAFRPVSGRPGLYVKAPPALRRAA